MTPGLGSYLGVLVWKNAIPDGGNLNSSSVPSRAWGEETEPEQHTVLPSDSRGALGLARTQRLETKARACHAGKRQAHRRSRAPLTSMLGLLVRREQVLGADLLAPKADLLLQFLDLPVTIFLLYLLLF